jgi:hypothetical protein
MFVFTVGICTNDKTPSDTNDHHNDVVVVGVLSEYTPETFAQISLESFEYEEIYSSYAKKDADGDIIELVQMDKGLVSVLIEPVQEQRGDNDIVHDCREMNWYEQGIQMTNDKTITLFALISIDQVQAHQGDNFDVTVIDPVHENHFDVTVTDPVHGNHFDVTVTDPVHGNHFDVTVTDLVQGNNFDVTVTEDHFDVISVRDSVRIHQRDDDHDDNGWRHHEMVVSKTMGTKSISQMLTLLDSTDVPNITMVIKEQILKRLILIY